MNEKQKDKLREELRIKFTNINKKLNKIKQEKIKIEEEMKKIC